MGEDIEYLGSMSGASTRTTPTKQSRSRSRSKGATYSHGSQSPGCVVHNNWLAQF